MSSYTVLNAETTVSLHTVHQDTCRGTLLNFQENLYLQHKVEAASGGAVCDWRARGNFGRRPWAVEQAPDGGVLQAVG